MSVNEMRTILLHQYGGERSPNWQRRVCAMSDQQVAAIYLRMQRAGTLYIPRSLQVYMSPEQRTQH